MADQERAGEGSVVTFATHADKVVSDALFELLCDCPTDDNGDEVDSCEGECQANENYADLGATAIAALRSLPVEQRMEAMGMRPLVSESAAVRAVVYGGEVWVPNG